MGTDFSMGVVRARHFSHTKWATISVPNSPVSGLCEFFAIFNSPRWRLPTTPRDSPRPRRRPPWTSPGPRWRLPGWPRDFSRLANPVSQLVNLHVLAASPRAPGGGAGPKGNPEDPPPLETTPQVGQSEDIYFTAGPSRYI
jgi:hypothetical protein